MRGLEEEQKQGWRSFSRHIQFSRFEHIAYQQWSVLHEGFRFLDVTNITGEAKWGSYMEDPQPGARLTGLDPLWISSKVLVKSSEGKLPLSETAPPFLVFH